jgi:hypothetical protein
MNVMSFGGCWRGASRNRGSAAQQKAKVEVREAAKGKGENKVKKKM